ncbi:hypothetical protein BU16DRAFT_535090 [Lophium mytilinum]|uniref:BZIP domain-containing protein n=1 Tax=Lophium mytilinum TaxID=390894 RepID=A0A6A6R6W1_9PEZI|nr:hypothetical protein BU16DRAFT_535090 [Lophium mytilinum]
MRIDNSRACIQSFTDCLSLLHNRPPHRALIAPSKAHLNRSADLSLTRPSVAASTILMETIEMSLREHLLAAGAGQPTAPQPISPAQAHSNHPSSPHAIDPAIAGTGYSMSAGDSGGDGHMSEGRKGRRELSTSKRAAQNRAAQARRPIHLPWGPKWGGGRGASRFARPPPRAFRQRKEEYIKQLKDQVKEFEQLCEMYKALQTENYSLRDYIINLQSRLLETQGEIPPAPANIDLTRPHGEAPTAHATNSDLPAGIAGGLSEREIGELRMAAQAAAARPEMNNGGKHHHEEAAYLPASSNYPDKRQKLDDRPTSSGSAPSVGDPENSL